MAISFSNAKRISVELDCGGSVLLIRARSVGSTPPAETKWQYSLVAERVTLIRL